MQSMREVDLSMSLRIFLLILIINILVDMNAEGIFNPQSTGEVESSDSGEKGNKNSGDGSSISGPTEGDDFGLGKPPVGVESTGSGHHTDGFVSPPVGQDEENKIVTCKGRCGEHADMPCSCHSKCFVYKNCCEDIDFDCPQMSAEKYARYGFLLNAAVVCNEYGVFMIDSCPPPVPPRRKRSLRTEMQKELELRENPESRSENQFNSESLDATEKRARENLLSVDMKEGADISDKNAVRNGPTSGGRMLAALRNAPVYDTETEFVYANMDVLRCYGGGESKVILWETELAMFGIDNKLITLDDIEERIKNSPPIYKPPVSLNNSGALAPCHRKAVGSEICGASDLDLKNACDGFASYVVGYGTDIYRNRFCFQCNKNETTFFAMYQKDTQGQSTMVKFSIMMSITESKTLRLVLNDEERRNQITWGDSTCGIYQVSDLKECDFTACEDGVTQSIDGTCTDKYAAFIGLGDDGFDLTENEKSKALEFLTCLIDDYLDIEVEKMDPYLIIQEDASLNTTVYVANLTVVVSNDHQYTAESSLASNLTDLHRALKAFKEYRKPSSRSICAVNWKREMDKDYKFSFNFIPTSLKSLNIVHDTKEDKDENQIIIDKSFTTLCFAVWPENSNTVGNLSCIQEPLYKSEVSAVLDMCNSTCISLLSEQFLMSEKNSGHLKTISLLVVFTVVAMATLITN